MNKLYSEALSVLRRGWGHDRFRDGQWDVIGPVCERRDTLGILPTGRGKSVCYQVPGLMLGGLVVVISPLIALMSDQLSGLARRGIPAASVTSAGSPADNIRVLKQAAGGHYRFLFVAPERFDSPVFRRLAKTLTANLLVVDEAHCVSEWGHDFRPAYLRLAAARTLLGNPPILALTATAPRRIRRDIVKTLRLRRPRIVIQGVDRPNIYWAVSPLLHGRKDVRTILADASGGVVVYLATRSRVEEWAAYLRRAGLRVSHYHGGLARRERDRSLDAWMDNRTPVMVATNAFGMGIDRADVRLVVHGDPPSTLESYYQEAGRAGRDGSACAALLTYSRSEHDVTAAGKRRLGGGDGSWNRRRLARTRFRSLQRYAWTRSCRRRFLLAHFGDVAGPKCRNCDNCDRDGHAAVRAGLPQDTLKRSSVAGVV